MELPKGWIETTIPELISNKGLFCDGDWIESKDQDPNGEVRLIQLADIGDGYFIDKSNRYLTKDRAKKLNCLFLQKEDVLIARMPDPLGRACVFPLDKQDYVTAVDVCIIRPGEIAFSNKWLMYFINAPEFRADIFKLQSGTTRKRISRRNFSTIQLPLPPLNEQHRIVAKLEELFTELDVAVEILKALQKQVKRYRQSVLKSAFEGKLTKKWREANADKLEPASKLLERIKEERKAKLGKKYKELPPVDTSELPELPEGWEWVTIENLISNEKNALKAGPFGSALKKEFYVNEGYKIYGQEQVIRGNEKYGDYYINSEKYSSLLSCKVQPFDVLISLVGTVGKVLILSEDIDEGIINPRLIKITLNRGAMLPNIFKSYFESELVKSIYKVKCHGATMDVLNLGMIKEIPFPICSIPEQVQINEEIDKHFSIAYQAEKTIEKSLKKAESLRQSILKRAFEGKLVPQDPNDEPASVLLERIKAEKEKLMAGKKKK